MNWKMKKRIMSQTELSWTEKKWSENELNWTESKILDPPRATRWSDSPLVLFNKTGSILICVTLGSYVIIYRREPVDTHKVNCW